MDWFEWAMKLILVAGSGTIVFGLLVSGIRIALGRPSRSQQWLETMARQRRDPAGDQDLAELRQTVERLGGDVAELQERLDFTERMLAQQRERPALPDGAAADARRSS
jgi:hypothetical protein